METGRDRFLRYLLQGGAVPDPQAVLDADVWLGRVLAAVCFLTDARANCDVLFFVRENLPLLLRQLHRSTKRERITYQGQIRGRIDWPTTTKTRLQNEVNPALYVCRPPLRQDNTPQNQLLKYLLTAIDNLIHDLPLEVQAAELWTAVSAQPVPLSQHLTQIAFHVRQALNHVRLRVVETPTVVTPHHLMKAHACKTELYALVAGMYEGYEKSALQCSWQSIYPAFSQAVILPQLEVPWSDQWIRLAATGFLQAQQQHAPIPKR